MQFSLGIVAGAGWVVHAQHEIRDGSGMLIVWLGKLEWRCLKAFVPAFDSTRTGSGSALLEFLGYVRCVG